MRETPTPQETVGEIFQEKWSGIKVGETPRQTKEREETNGWMKD